MKTYSSEMMELFCKLEQMYNCLFEIQDQIATLDAFDDAQEHHVRIAGEKCDIKIDGVNVNDLKKILSKKEFDTIDMIYARLIWFKEEMKNDESE